MADPERWSLRSVRLARGLSSREVAARLGVTAACLLRWERRQRHPAPDLRAALAAVLGLDVAEVTAFFAEGADHPPADATMPGHGLRALRRSLGVPPRRIAEALSVKVHTVYSWERGGSRLPARLLDPLARCLGADTDQVVRALREAQREERRVARLTGELARLRVAAGFSQSRAAVAVGVSRATLRRWERGRVVPPWHAVRVMAVLYGASFAVVAKAVRARKPAFLLPEAWSPGDLPEVLHVLRTWHGLTQARVAEHCATSADSVRGWEHGRQQPGPQPRARLEALYQLPEGSLLRAYAGHRSEAC